MGDSRNSLVSYAITPVPSRLLLCGVCLVVHEEKVEVAGVVDEECLVAGRHHVTSLLVVAIADLSFSHG